MAEGGCCASGSPPLGPARLGQHLRVHVRAAIAADCARCLARYAPGGDLLAAAAEYPGVAERVQAIGEFAVALTRMRRSPPDHAQVIEQLTRAAALWPGTDNGRGTASALELDARLLESPPPEPVDMPRWRDWFRRLGLPVDLAFLCCALLHPDPGPPAETRRARLYLMEPENAYAVCDGSFCAAVFAGGTGAVVPHPTRMLSVSLDASFLAAVEDAHRRAVVEQLLKPAHDVVWWIETKPTGLPHLEDRSVGLAAGVSMAVRLGTRTSPPPPGHWVFAGSVRAFDGDQLADLEVLSAKYQEARRQLPGVQLIVPQRDFDRFAADTRQQLAIQGVESLHDALILAARPSARRGLPLPWDDDERLAPDWGLRALNRIAERAGVDGRAVLVVGAPGTGKTAMLNLMGVELTYHGWVVAEHWCNSFGRGQRVFAPFRALLDQLHDQLRSSGDALAAKDFAALRADLDDPLDGAPETGRFRVRRGSIGRRLFERVGATLAAHAGRRRIALLLYDLHWADETSRMLFIELAKRVSAGGAPQLLLAGALRHDAGVAEPFERELTAALSADARAPSRRDQDLSADARAPSRRDQDLSRSGRTTPLRFELLDLSQMPEPAQDRLVCDTLTAGRCTDPDPVLLQLLRTRTAGNVFWMKLTVNWLYETNHLELDGGRWSLDGIEASDLPTHDQMIDYFLSTLPDPTQQALRAAAVAGRRFDLRVLAQAMGDDTDLNELRNAMDDSQLAVAVDQPDRSSPIYKFVHPRVSARLAETLPRGRRQLLHRRLAEAYEHESPHDHVCHLLARHREEAAQFDQSAGHWAELAARDRQLGAYDTAIDDRRHELECRQRHRPSEEDRRSHWQLSTAEALIDQAGVHRLRGKDGDLARADELVQQARQTLDEMFPTGSPTAPERMPGLLPAGLGQSWLLAWAQALAEGGEVARLQSRLDAAQESLEAAMDWGERLRTLGGERQPELRAQTGHVLAKAGCSLMSLYMTRAMHYRKYEPHNEDARRAQEQRVMFLCTRLLALSDHLEATGEDAELRVRVLRTQGNVFFWLESDARLAWEYYQRAEQEFSRALPERRRSQVGVRVGEADQDIYDVRARLCLSRGDAAAAHRELLRYRAWAEEKGASEHIAAADYTEALIHAVAATSAAPTGFEGSLERAAQLLEAAIEAPFAYYAEHRFQALLLRRWVARQRADVDAQDREADLLAAQARVWGRIPAHFGDDRELQLYCEVSPDVPWWVMERIGPAPVTPGAARLYKAAVAHHRLLAASVGGDGGIDLADELRARVVTRVSRTHFQDRVRAVAEQAERLCAIHYPSDARLCRALQCAAWVHDCLTECSEAELRCLAEELEVPTEPLEHAHPRWLHGRLGFTLVERELTDRLAREDADFTALLAETLEYHSWPGERMSRPAKLFLVACTLVTLRARVRRARADLRELSGDAAAAGDQRALTIRLERDQPALVALERCALEPERLEEAVDVVVDWIVARRRAEGEFVHRRTLALWQRRGTDDQR